jgi:transcriptional regulator with XRE-family HTH domain
MNFMTFRGNILPIMTATPQGIGQAIAARVKARRLQLGWSRETLASRAGINLWSLKRFEITGKVALESLVKLAIVLGNLPDFEALFAARPKEPASMVELEQLNPPSRVRGTTLP